MDVPQDVEEQCRALCNKVRRHTPRLRVFISRLVQNIATRDNKRAQSVVISGATGLYSSSINGCFDPTSEIHEDRIRYCKRGDAGVWIEHFKKTKGRLELFFWQIKRAQDKGSDSFFILTSGKDALEASKKDWWFRYSGTLCVIGTKDEDKMAGVKVHLEKDVEHKVGCPYKLFLRAAFRQVLISLCFYFRLLLKPRLLLKGRLLLKPKLLQKPRLLLTPRLLLKLRLLLKPRLLL